jgi:hypothetical protein
MLTISEAQRRTELFLTGQMLEALRAVEYELLSSDTQLHDVVWRRTAARVSRFAIARRFRCHLPHQRLRRRAVYAAAAQRSPARRRLSRARTRCARCQRPCYSLERWRIGAEHAGWKFGWRDSAVAGDPSRRLSKHIAMPSSAITFSKTRATLLAQRHCAGPAIT